MKYEPTIVVTGGAGFIGSAFVRHVIANSGYRVVNVDCLTYASNLASLEAVSSHQRYSFEKVDICDQKSIVRIFREYKPKGIIHLAAESHVDRSILGSSPFIQTNIVGTHNLLEVAREYWGQLSNLDKSQFRFLHVSTDEVYGSLGNAGYFVETSRYEPNSPYSASKAASDHLVRAWHHTYGLPVLTTNCSNNFGPYQHPEKLIPLMILNAIDGLTLPVYGNGNNVRDWLYVDDHVRALQLVFEKGVPGEVYNIGGNNEKKNIDVVHAICDLLDQMVPNKTLQSRRSLIKYVPDRPGHDQRYAIDATKIKTDLGWVSKESFLSALKLTIEWYLDNRIFAINSTSRNS